MNCIRHGVFLGAADDQDDRFDSSSAGLIDRGAGFSQCMFPRQIEGRKLLCAVFDGKAPFRVFYQCVIALPMSMRLLMHLHLDLNAFVDVLNHKPLLRQARPAGPFASSGLIALAKGRQLGSPMTPFALSLSGHPW
jgi:hypothetical protein